jgi:hypothetical protein
MALGYVAFRTLSTNVLKPLLACFAEPVPSPERASRIFLVSQNLYQLYVRSSKNDWNNVDQRTFRYMLYTHESSRPQNFPPQIRNLTNRYKESLAIKAVETNLETTTSTTNIPTNKEATIRPWENHPVPPLRIS